MVEKRPVSVGWQIVFILIPYVWIYAFYRIEKLRMGVVLFVIAVIASIGLQMILPFPYGMISVWPVSIVVPIYFIRKWSIEWNDKCLQNE